MIVQALLMACLMLLTLQMMLFTFVSPGAPLRVAYVDSWRVMGRIIAHLFQIQRGPQQWIGIAALGLMGFYVLLLAGLNLAARFTH